MSDHVDLIREWLLVRARRRGQILESQHRFQVNVPWAHKAKPLFEALQELVRDVVRNTEVVVELLDEEHNLSGVCFEVTSLDLLEESAVRGVRRSDHCQVSISQVQFGVVVDGPCIDDVHSTGAHPFNEIFDCSAPVAIPAGCQMLHDLLRKGLAGLLRPWIIQANENQNVLTLSGSTNQAPAPDGEESVCDADSMASRFKRSADEIQGPARAEPGPPALGIVRAPGIPHRRDDIAHQHRAASR